MPLRQPMQYEGRALKERGPHQIATALAMVLEEFAETMEKRQADPSRTVAKPERLPFNVGQYPELEQALLHAGAAIIAGVTPNPGR